jgi:hypothetical protein
LLIYVLDLWNTLKEQGNKIIIAEDIYLHPRAFIFYIKQLEELDVKNKARYHDFALECLKDFIENNIGWIRDDKFGHAQELLGFIFYNITHQTYYFLTRVNGILLICSSALFVMLI